MIFNLTSNTFFKWNTPPPPLATRKFLSVGIPFQAGFTVFGSKRELRKLKKVHSDECNTVLADACVLIVESRKMRRTGLAAT